MKVQEVFNVLLENPNPAIVRHKAQGRNCMSERNNTQLPIYSGSKGGRYWFDCDLVSEDEIIALFGLAVIIEQKPVIVHIPLSIHIEDIDQTDAACLVAHIDFDKEGELILPLMDLGVAEQLYKQRSNGYCNFKSTQLINNKVHAELGSELCLDELLAIYSILQEKKKALQHGNKSNQTNS